MTKLGPRRKLESWKEIANYLRVSVRTVQRWEEQSGLPVHRLLKDKGAGVFAFTDELDGWTSSRVVEAGETVVEEVEAAAEKKAVDWRWLAGIGAAVLLLTGGVVSWVLLERRAPLGPLKTERVTVSPGLEAQVDVSPTGDRIAYGWYAEGKQGIGVQVLATREVKRITEGVVSEYSPQWSPDGKRIAFLRHQGGIVSDLMLYDGVGVERIDAVTGQDWQDTFRAGPFLQWLPDGNGLLVTGCNLKRTSCWVEALDLKSRRRQRVVEVGRPLFGLALEPEGRRLGVVLVEGRSMAAFVTPLSSSWVAAGPLERLEAGERPQFALNWLRGGRAIFLQSPVMGSPSEAGVSVAELRMQTMFGTKLVLLQHAGPNVSFDVARDGRIYWSAVPFDTSMRVLDAERGTLGKALCDSTSMERFPRLSEDGRRLAFVTNREGSTNICVCDWETQETQYVTRSRDAGVWGPAWSPDGKLLAFTMSEAGETSRLAIWRDGGELTKLTPTNLQVGEPTWAPDGKSLYFIGNSEGVRRIFSIGVDGGELRDLGETRAGEIAMRRDGQMWVREAEELLLWDLRTGKREGMPVKRGALRGLDRDGLGAYLNVKVEPGLYGLEGWIYREGQTPRRVAPTMERVMGWHYTPVGKTVGVVHELPEGDVYRSEPLW